MNERLVTEPSEEVDERQLDLARTAGETYQQSVQYMANDVAHTGGTEDVGEYVIGFAQEEAEGLWHLRGEGDLEWVEPDRENCHLEVVVSDPADGRFVPYVHVEATLIAEDGTEIGPYEIPFVWHPGLYHYGRNLDIPGDGTYDVHIRVEPPTFERHDRKNGNRYGQAATVTFENVDIETGQS